RCRSGALVQRHDAGAAQAEIVLQRETRVLDLPRFGRAAQLVRQLVTLREARGAERVPLREQPAGRIGDNLPAIGVVAILDEAFGATFAAEAQRLVGDELVMGEAV